MIKQFAYISLLVGGCASLAQADQGCPYPSAIKYVDDHLQATTGKARWQSQKVERRDFIDAFVGSLFVPDKDQDRQNGYLEKCVYRTGGGQLVALRYGAKDDVYSMALSSSDYWRLAKDPFGEDVYICQDSQPDNCSFTATKP